MAFTPHEITKENILKAVDVIEENSIESITRRFKANVCLS